MKVEEIERSIELSGAEAWAIVTGVPLFPLDAPRDGEPFFVTSEAVRFGIARIEEERAVLLALACPHASHGAHPRVASKLSEARERVKAAGLDKWIKFNAPETCPMCGGAAWLPPESEQARGVVVMAHSFGIFRGVQIPGDSTGLTELDQLGMIRELFANLTTPASEREAQDASALRVPPGQGRGVGFLENRKGRGEEDGRDPGDNQDPDLL